MNAKRKMFWLAAGALVLSSALPLMAQSSISIGELTLRPGTRTLVAPIYVETDGMADGQPMQSMAFRMAFAPMDAVASATVKRAGVIADRKPLFEAVPLHEDTVSYMAMFLQNERPKFKSMAGDRNLIAYVELTLAEGVSDDTIIALVLDPKISTLANFDGTREQSVAKGTLRIGDPIRQSLRLTKVAASE